MGIDTAYVVNHKYAIVTAFMLFMKCYPFFFFLLSSYRYKRERKKKGWGPGGGGMDPGYLVSRSFVRHMYKLQVHFNYRKPTCTFECWVDLVPIVRCYDV